MSVLAEADVARLALIKYQLQTARQQTAAPSPVDNLALNTMQDAVEATLALCALRLNVPLQREFDKLLGDVIAKLSNPTDFQGHKERMKRLNTARVSFKHHGNPAESASIRQHLEYAESACAALVVEVYATELSEIAMTALVSNARVRGWLDTSRRLRDAGDLPKSLGDLGAAFQTLRDEAREGAPSFPVRPTRPIRAREQDKVADDLRQLVDSVHGIAEYLRVYALGVEPREYAFFAAHVPRVDFMWDSGNRSYWAGIEDGKQFLDEDTYNRLVKFVVDTSLQLDARHFTPPATHSNAGLMFRRELTDEVPPPE